MTDDTQVMTISSVLRLFLNLASLSSGLVEQDCYRQCYASDVDRRWVGGEDIRLKRSFDRDGPVIIL